MLKLLILLACILLVVGGVLLIGITVVRLIVKLFRAIFGRQSDTPVYRPPSTSAPANAAPPKPTEKPLPNHPRELEKLWETASAKKDYTMVYRTANRLVEKGYPYHWSLGECYLHGRGVEQNRPRALSCFNEALRLGDPKDMGRYADLLFDGVYLQQDKARALELYRKAAAQNDPHACMVLYRMQTQGDLPDQQYDEDRLAWMLLTAAIDNESDARELFKVHGIMYGYAAELYAIKAKTAEDENQLTESLHYTKLAASYGDQWSLYRLGMHYEKGLGCNYDIDAAIRYYTAAAELYDHTQSMYRLGCLHMGDRTTALTDHMHEQQVYWFTRAADNGHGGAADKLGLYYLNEYRYNMHADVESFLVWFRRGAELGNGLAMYHLYRVYSQDANICPDPVLAEKYLRMAAAAGIEKARRMLLSGRW